MEAVITLALGNLNSKAKKANLLKVTHCGSLMEKYSSLNLRKSFSK